MRIWGRLRQPSSALASQLRQMSAQTGRLDVTARKYGKSSAPSTNGSPLTEQKREHGSVKSLAQQSGKASIENGPHPFESFRPSSLGVNSQYQRMTRMPKQWTTVPSTGRASPAVTTKALSSDVIQ